MTNVMPGALSGTFHWGSFVAWIGLASSSCTIDIINSSNIQHSYLNYHSCGQTICQQHRGRLYLSFLESILNYTQRITFLEYWPRTVGMGSPSLLNVIKTSEWV